MFKRIKTSFTTSYPENALHLFFQRSLVVSFRNPLLQSLSETYFPSKKSLKSKIYSAKNHKRQIRIAMHLLTDEILSITCHYFLSRTFSHMGAFNRCLYIKVFRKAFLHAKVAQ